MSRKGYNLVLQVFMLVIALSHLAFATGSKNSLSLAGKWQFAIDRHDVGIQQKWFDKSLGDVIALPGILQSQGYGDEISKDTPWVLSLYDRNWYLRKEYKKYAREGSTKVPFLCQPPHHYLGRAWYQREINIPRNWDGDRVVLFLERTRWKTTVWLDDNIIGSCDSLVAAHEFDLGRLNTGNYRLTICVDNRMQMQYRPDAHSVSDSLGSTWNGIVGEISLRRTTPVWIDDLQVYPDIKSQKVKLKAVIGNSTGLADTGFIMVSDMKVPVSWDAEGGYSEFEIQFDNVELWSEFNPKLYNVKVELKSDNTDDSREVSFGFRDISTQDNMLLVNGIASHFRGTHSGGDFPETGYPATGVEYWRDLFTTCKEWGLNHMRFHSFCPPEAAFEAADEIGFYLQPEAGMWNVISPGTDMEKRMYQECDRMIKSYGNHPSFMLFSPSNEPKGHWKESLTKWVEHYRKEDPRRLYTTGTGWPLIDSPGPVEGADFLAVHRVGIRPVRSDSAWFGRDYLRSVTGVDVPIIVHELGQWCAYPDFDIIKKFTGYLRPGNYEIFRDSMAQAGLLDMDKKFAQASGKLQAECYKEEIEANLRTPGLAGFQLLDLHDYVGQGTALVGVLDAFWDAKGYISASQWKRFCNVTVPLAVLKKRVFKANEAFDIEVQVAHYGLTPLRNADFYWNIVDEEGNVSAKGNLHSDEVKNGSAIHIGNIVQDLTVIPAPCHYKLVVGISGTAIENDWDFWLYPENNEKYISDSILVTTSFENAITALNEGSKVLLMPEADKLQWNCPPIGRKPIFWNRLMGPKWERFLGLYCNPNHPVFDNFITDSYYQWHWSQVFSPYCKAVNLDSLSLELKPMVWMIDDWNRNYKLAGLFECEIGKGKLVVCAADLISDLDTRPVARQLRNSILKYMDSDKFNPNVSISGSDLLKLQYDNHTMRKLGATVNVEPNDGAITAGNVIDGNPDTYWLSGGNKQKQNYPHEITISFAQKAEISGLYIMNRQDQREHQGDIRELEIEISSDGDSWTKVKQGLLESTFDLQMIVFDKSYVIKVIKIKALTGFGGDTYAAIAKVGAIYSGKELPELEQVESHSSRQVSSATVEMYEAVDILASSSNISAKLIEDIAADSESATDPVEYAFDGDPQTFWHTKWRGSSTKQPHWVQVEFKEVVPVEGMCYLPRQNHSNGRIKDYIVECSLDGNNWHEVARGAFTSDAEKQIVKFDKTINARYVKLVSKSELAGQDFASIAELSFIVADEQYVSDDNIQRGNIANKPLFRDPVYDGAADSVICFNRDNKKWYMFYTNRRANVAGLSGVSWVHGTPIGIAESADGANWKYCQDANIQYEKKNVTFWAPEVIYSDGTYHMYLTIVPGVFANWSHPRDIAHFTSDNLLDWEYQSTLKLASDKVIDACVFRMPGGNWRMWYNNERDRKSIYYAESSDLYNWADKGKAVGDRSGEGPAVFEWKGYFWMIVDNWRGLGVYRSVDCNKWERQNNNLLQEPGKGKDDKVKGGHAGIVVNDDRAYLFYFTHPGRTPENANKDSYEQRRSSIQVVEVKYDNGWIQCDRDKPTFIELKPLSQ